MGNVRESVFEREAAIWRGWLDAIVGARSDISRVLDVKAHVSVEVRPNQH